jgi:hypothetical protein
MESLAQLRIGEHVRCPAQLCEEAIATFEPELPPLEESRITPAHSAIASQLRSRFTDASSSVKILMRTMRDVWISWHSLPVVSTGRGSDLTGCVFLCIARFLRII